MLTSCFTNSVETIFFIVAFYYFLDVKDKFDRNMVIMTTLISFSFMIRNTSPVGWIPLFFVKVVFEGSFMPFLLAGMIVAVPIVAFCVLLDSIYYGGDSFTFTFWNFV